MYSSCIFCSARLGANESIEEFPVGRGLAFDSAKGRLWAVCGKCGRWNLAPIEERWEATEAAERLFRDSRLRVHSENIGLARLPDGTRLIRIGQALDGELAAWRYADHFRKRRQKHLTWTAVGAAGVAAIVVGGIPLFAAIGAPLAAGGHLVQLAGALYGAKSARKVLHRVPAEQSPTGAELLVKTGQVGYMRVVPDSIGTGLAIELPSPLPAQRVEEPGTVRSIVRWVPADPVRIEGVDAQRVIARSLVLANGKGATTEKVDAALERLDAGGSRESFLSQVAHLNGGLFTNSLGGVGGPNAQPRFDPRGTWRRFRGTFRGELIRGERLPLPGKAIPEVDRLALEMVLNEETERRALEGELTLLASAWREAEEIAAIADALPHDPLERLQETA
jgi:hypothetical protein